MVLLLVNPETWTWANTWTVTGLGFGIVLALLFVLVFILMFFGWTMQKIEAPKTPKAPKEEKNPVSQPAKVATGAPSDAEKAAIALAISEAHSDDEAAVAYALYLAHHTKHDIPTGMIHLNQHETAWNTKSTGMNNVGF